MSKVGQRERLVQDRVIALFTSLGYDYLGNWRDRDGNSNIEPSYLRTFLHRRGYSTKVADRALHALTRVAGDQTKSLYDVNRALYDLLRYGVKVRPDAGENVQTVWLIDWKVPLNNHFAVAEEVTVLGANTKRPDLVLYVNGIALGVLELKRSIVSVSEGIRQNLDNQGQEFIRRFFATVQLLMAGNDTEGLRYGVIETPQKYYLTWKEDGAEAPLDRLLDVQLSHLCARERFLEIIHDFIAFDAGVKKICRPNQYFGVKAAQARVRTREGGILWHTQGSGKSLTMVWLAKWVREHYPDARLLIITDRVELDQQIEGVFLGVNEEIHRTHSGADLVSCLNATTPWLICSLVHKFAGKEDQEGDVDGYVEQLHRSLPPGFSPKGDFLVYVDECHRSQSGALHQAMKALLPGAMFIGFTGTPLLRADKQRSIEVFGRYIHTYKYDQAVRDGVVLDLRYEARDVDQDLTSPERVDQWFAAKTRGLNDVALAQLKRRWGTMQQVLSSRSRLEQIVDDILMDMETRDRLLSGRGNALLVSDSIYNACKFYELFLAHGFDKCAIVTSYRPSAAAIALEETGEGETERLHQYAIYRRMLAAFFHQTEDQAMGRADEFERKVKDQFVHEPGQIKLLIVVDKLLTGFDAPPATYLYIDKPMQDHALFQAICRVNRLDGDDKQYGYIVDYRDLFRSLEGAIHDYTSEAFDRFDPEDVENLLTDRLERAKERLEAAREAIEALCEPVAPPRDTAAYLHFFCARNAGDREALRENEPKRIALYRLTVSLIRAYAELANEMPQAGYSPSQIAQVRAEVEHYEKARTEVKLASGDYIDLKMYEPAMRHLIDTYIRAEPSEKVSAFDDLTLIQLVVERGSPALDELPGGLRRDHEAAAEAIANNVRRVITDEMPSNPRYFERMSELLDTLIRQRREEALQYQEYLAKLIELTREVTHPAPMAYPQSLNSPAKRALYESLGRDEGLALGLDAEIRRVKRDDWRSHPLKRKEVLFAIRRYIPGQAEADEILLLVENQGEY